MPGYRYSARDANGRLVAASLDAPTRREALRLLAARGLQPVSLEDAAGERSGPGAAPAAAAAGLSRREHLPFLEALHELTASGLSGGEAVRLLSTRLKEKNLRLLSASLWESLSGGLTLSQAMEQIPRVFDRQTVSLVRAAEATGNLTEVLQRLIEHFSQQREMRQRLTTALVYPAFVCLLAFGVILFFVFFLLPRLQGLLASLGGKLPLATQLVVAGAQFLVRYGVLLVPLAVVAGVAFWRWRQTEQGRRLTDAWVLKIAYVRGFVIEATLLNFTQILAVLLENGIPTVEALRLTERTVANRSLQAELHQATDRVLEGASLSAALGRTGFFPDLLLDRLAIGESTGKLAPCLRDISRNYANRHTRRLHALTSVISTAVLLFAFTFVGLIAYAIVSAVLEVSASFKF
jgi:type II secretory pathway component PulF